MTKYRQECMSFFFILITEIREVSCRMVVDLGQYDAAFTDNS